MTNFSTILSFVKKGEEINARFVEAFEYLESKGIIKSRTEAAEKVKCSRQVLTETLMSRMNATTYLLRNFFLNYRVRPDFIFLGLKPIMFEDNRTDSKTVSVSVPGLPLVPVDAIAGMSNGTGDAIMLAECEQYIIPEFQNKADYLIRVNGSSMYPKYNSGDIVACKKLPLDTFFQWNKVYVLDTIQGALVKRVKKSEKNDCITLVSDNEKYKEFDIKLKEINSIALVIGVIRLE